jgi:anti-sigma factor RsiW
MNHLTEAQLNEYLDGELERRERSAVEAHLAACPACRAALEELLALAAAVESLPDAPLTHDLAPLVLAKLPPPRLALGWKLVLAAQAGAALGLSLLIVANLLPGLRLPALEAILPLSLPAIEVPAFDLPTSILPPFHSLPLEASPFNVIFLAASALLLWGVGNAVLLRGRPEVRK